MQADGKIVIIEPPQGLKKDFGLRPCIDENKGGVMGFDMGVDILHRVSRGMTRPRQITRFH